MHDKHFHQVLRLTPSYRRAPIPPQVEHDLNPQARPDVNSPQVTSVPSNYSGETDTQYERIEREAEEAEETTRKRFHEAEGKAKTEYNKAKKAAKKGAREAEAEAQSAAASLKENRENPVVVGNFVAWTAIAAALG